MTIVSKDNSIIVGMADIKTGQAPAKLKTSLGSCIGLCIYASNRKIGGMIHFMMASAGNVINKEGFKKAKYADTGIPELLDQLKKTYNVTPRDCIAKMFGGGKILKNVTNDIGESNAIAARAILKDLGIRIVAYKTGGEKGYNIKLDLETGNVLCQVFGEQPEEF